MAGAKVFWKRLTRVKRFRGFVAPTVILLSTRARLASQQSPFSPTKRQAACSHSHRDDRCVYMLPAVSFITGSSGGFRNCVVRRASIAARSESIPVDWTGSRVRVAVASTLSRHCNVGGDAVHVFPGVDGFCDIHFSLFDSARVRDYR